MDKYFHAQILFLSLFLCKYGPTSTILIEEPSDQTVCVGSMVTLPCTSNISAPVLWRRLRRYEQEWESIYEGSRKFYPIGRFAPMKEILDSDSNPDDRIEVRGLTVVDNKLFVASVRERLLVSDRDVISDTQSQIKVYDLRSPTPSLETLCSRPKTTPNVKILKISGMTSPRGLAGCADADNKVLYISDDERKCIHRADLAKKSDMTPWQMTESYEPWGLSLTAEHNLLITVRIRNKDGASRVLEYTNQQVVLRDIRLKEDFRHAWQTVKLSDNQFIVCHGDSMDSKHRVCHIDADCNIIKSFGRGMQDGEEPLWTPRSLTIDNERKYIFVADTCNNRIRIFDYNLTYLGHIYTPRRVALPVSLYFDSSANRLFVGEYEVGSPLSISPTIECQLLLRL